MQQHPEQGIAVSLSAGEHADALEHFVRGKKETAEERSQFSFGRPWREVAQVVDDARIWVEFFVLVLREVIGLHVVSEFEFARGERLGLGQKLNQRGFSGAVHTHQGNAVSTLNEEVNVLEDVLL